MCTVIIIVIIYYYRSLLALPYKHTSYIREILSPETYALQSAYVGVRGIHTRLFPFSLMYNIQSRPCRYTVTSRSKLHAAKYKI